jgi:hypothetical protein
VLPKQQKDAVKQSTQRGPYNKDKTQKELAYEAIVKQGLSVRRAAEQYGVSKEYSW